jgi:hypothetical protein
MMKYSVVKILCFLLPAIYTANAQTIPAPTKEDILYRKNFILLYSIEHMPVTPAETKAFKKVRMRLEQDGRNDLNNCREAGCFVNLAFSQEEINAVGNELVRLVKTEKDAQELVMVIRMFNSYSLYNSEADTGFIRKAWEAEARGVNNILSVYIEGGKPLYPKIDSISFKKDDPVFRDSIGATVKHILEHRSDNDQFFKIPVWLALKALLLNGRDEAARYEPLIEKYNASANVQTYRLNWKQFPYGAILVPGLGPEQPGVKLDPAGARRCDSAAVRFRAGLAPFIVVSGGHVHPNKTPYCEAIEMKNYLVNVLHIPGSAVIVEPYARHTTTNLRNTNRIFFALNIPNDKPILIVTDAAQTNYINGPMKDKIVKELGYLPFTSIRQISTTETAYLPSENSRQINSMDPLDP